MAIKLNGSTSGSVALDAPADTSPSGTDVTLTLPTSAGSSGQYLQTNGSGTLSWAGAGKILQVVSAVYMGQESTTSTSYVDHNLNASIIPSSTSSKILILININVQCNGITHYFNIARDGTDINTDADGLGLARAYSVDNNWPMICFQYLDSPAKNTSTTYRLRHKVDGSTGYIGYNSNDEQYMYLLEVAG